MKKSILITLVAVIIGVILIAVIIPNAVYIVRHPKPGVKSNMHCLQLYIEDFAERANKNYPASINTTIKELLEDLGIESDVDTSIAGAGNRDTLFTEEIGSVGPCLLPPNYANPFGKSQPVLITSRVDPPKWDKNYIGVVYYVPLEVKGNIAKGYKIYGAGHKELLELVLTSKGLKELE